MKDSLCNEAILAFCRLGVAGLAPKAPGTCGTGLACLLAPFLFFPLSIPLRILLLVLLFFAGGWAASKAEIILAQKDPGQVVIDELVGVWLVLLPFKNASFWLIFSAFICFRIFDIIKPWPVKASENWLPGGYGIMIDDVIAGFYAMAAVYLLRYFQII